MWPPKMVAVPRAVREKGSVVAADQGHEPALDADTVWPEDAGFIGRVGCFESDGGALFAKTFQRGLFLIDQSDNDIAAMGVIRTLEDDQIPVMDPGIDHRIALHLERKVLIALGQVGRWTNPHGFMLDRFNRHTRSDPAKHRNSLV